MGRVTLRERAINLMIDVLACLIVLMADAPIVAVVLLFVFLAAPSIALTYLDYVEWRERRR